MPFSRSSSPRNQARVEMLTVDHEGTVPYSSALASMMAWSSFASQPSASPLRSTLLQSTTAHGGVKTPAFSTSHMTSSVPPSPCHRAKFFQSCRFTPRSTVGKLMNCAACEKLKLYGGFSRSVSIQKS